MMGSLMGPRIWVIVPTLNEESAIEETLQSLKADGHCDVLVVDGGSSDLTVSKAKPLASRVIPCGGGLFAQLNHGARQVTGDVFLFHYADVRFPPGGRRAIEQALESPQVVGGAFALRFQSERTFYKIIA